MHVHFLQFWLKGHFTNTEFCDLYVEIVQGEQNLMLYITIVHVERVHNLAFWSLTELALLM